MKRSSKNDEPAKALQKLAQAPADSKGLQYAKIIESAPRKRRGNRIEVTSKKTREEFADELTGEIEKATGVPLEVASRIATQMTQAQVWPWSEGGTEALIKAVTTIAELGPRNAIQAGRNVVAGREHRSGNRGVPRFVRADEPDSSERVKEHHIAEDGKNADDDVIQIGAQSGFHAMTNFRSMQKYHDAQSR